MKKLLIYLTLASMFACKPQNPVLVLKSPSGNLKTIITQIEGNILYSIVSVEGDSETIVIPASPLGITRNDAVFSGNLTTDSVSQSIEISETYTMVSGKQKEISYHANEATLYLTNSKGNKLNIIFRAFDEGFAFRYLFPEQTDSTLKVISEQTGFQIPSTAEGWMAPYQLAKEWGDPGYESDFMNMQAGTASIDSVGWAFPLLFKSENKWIFISESNLGENYCGTHLNKVCDNGLYTIALPQHEERYGDGEVNPTSTLPWLMPWRFFIISNEISTIVESSMVHHLADPSVIEDLSWIKPGRASWEWLTSKGGRTVKDLKKFVDLAAEMTWEYSLVDAGWENMPDGKIEEVVEYAKKKNVGLLFWYNSGGRRAYNTSESSTFAFKNNEDFVMFNDDTRDKEMARIAALGVKGIKVDFFATDKQIAIQLYHKILRDAAKHKILVNFHGCTLPRGWARTYPNLLAMEAVKGSECYRFASNYPDISAHYNTIAPILRGSIGSADYTPSLFTNQKYPRKSTSAHELALSLIYESGIIHFADKMEGYQSLPAEALTFLKQLPVVWDETKLINASPGNHFIIARKNGNKWFIAGVNGKDEAQELSIKLPVAIENPTLFADGVNLTDLKIEKLDGQISEYKISMQAKGGFVLY